MILHPWTLRNILVQIGQLLSTAENSVIVMGYIRHWDACRPTPRSAWRDVPRGPEVNRTWLLLNWKRERGGLVIARNKRWWRRWTVHLRRRLMKILVLRLTLGGRVNCFPWFLHPASWEDANQRDRPFISPRAERKNEGRARQERTEEDTWAGISKFHRSWCALYCIRWNKNIWEVSGIINGARQN